MSAKVIIVGAFHEVIELCEDCGFTIVGLIDDKKTGVYMGYPVIGTDDDRNELKQQYPDSKIVITPDSPEIRKKLVRKYKEAGFDFATVISPKSIISRSAVIGKGTIIQSGVNISSASVIGEFAKLNIKANIMHDNVIADFVTIAPNAVLLGYVNVYQSAYIGANSTILPRLSVGAGATVGAGAVVTKDIPNHQMVKGVPAK